MSIIEEIIAVVIIHETEMQNRKINGEHRSSQRHANYHRNRERLLSAGGLNIHHGMKANGSTSCEQNYDRSNQNRGASMGPSLLTSCLAKARRADIFVEPS